MAALASGAVQREGGLCLGGGKAGRVAEIDHNRPCSAQVLSKARVRLGNLPLTQWDPAQPCPLGLSLPICRVGTGAGGLDRLTSKASLSL